MRRLLKRGIMGLGATVMLLGIQAGTAGGASASYLAWFWDSETPRVGDNQGWVYGSDSWTCSTPAAGAGADAYVDWIGPGLNDRYSSGDTGTARCTAYLYQDAGRVGYIGPEISKYPISGTPRNFSLQNHSANNQVSSLDFS